MFDRTIESCKHVIGTGLTQMLLAEAERHRIEYLLNNRHISERRQNLWYMKPVEIKMKLTRTAHYISLRCI